MRASLVPMAVLGLLFGCSNGDDADAAPSAPGLAPSDFAVAWTDETGAVVPDGVGEPNPELTINTVTGPEHCGWESAVMLHLTMPVGDVAPSTATPHQYVRDPNRVLPQQGNGGRFDPAARLPDDAEPTGLMNGEIELWVAPSTVEREVYVGRGGAFEAWPRAGDLIACA